MKRALRIHSASMSSLSQILADVPFDMQHHRALKYLPNAEGMRALETSLTKKLKQFCITPKGDMPEETLEENIPF